MEKTLSLHGGRKASIDHNRRIEGKEGKHSTINKELSCNNVTLVDIDVKDAYKDIFQDAVDAYNETQKRSDRKIKNYYSKIQHDKRKNTHYEYIFQLGNIKSRMDDDTFISICADYVAEFQTRNPNLYLIGAYVHLDEEASPHMHMDYIPIGHYDKGLRLQASSNKAFEELTGYKSVNRVDTAQIQWQNRERDYIKELCKGYGIEVIDGDSKGKKSLSIEEFKAQKAMESAQQKQEEANRAEQDAAERIQRAETEADKKVSEAENRAAQAEQDVSDKIEQLDTELADAKERFNKTKHKMNMEYKEKRDQLDKKLKQLDDSQEQLDGILKDYQNKIHKTWMVGEKYDLNEHRERAHEIANELNHIIDEFDR